MFCLACSASYPLDRVSCEADGTPLIPADDSAGTTVGSGYVVGAIVRSDALGTCYEAAHPNVPGARFALFAVQSAPAESDAIWMRFRSKAQALRNLKHARTAHVRELGRMPDGRPYVVGLFPEGRPLSEALREWGTPSPRGAVRLGRQLAQAVATAHRKAIVHHDLRPENVYVTGSDAAPQCTVFGFGLSVFREAALKSSPVPLSGSALAFLAPEQALGEVGDHRADVYAIGAILFRFVTGHEPTPATADRVEASLRALAPNVPSALAAVIAQAMAPNPADRYAFLDKLDAALAPIDEEGDEELFDQMFEGLDASSGAPGGDGPSGAQPERVRMVPRATPSSSAPRPATGPTLPGPSGGFAGAALTPAPPSVGPVSRGAESRVGPLSRAFGPQARATADRSGADGAVSLRAPLPRPSTPRPSAPRSSSSPPGADATPTPTAPSPSGPPRPGSKPPPEPAGALFYALPNEGGDAEGDGQPTPPRPLVSPVPPEAAAKAGLAESDRADAAQPLEAATAKDPAASAETASAVTPAAPTEALTGNAPAAPAKTTAAEALAAPIGPATAKDGAAPVEAAPESAAETDQPADSAQPASPTMDSAAVATPKRVPLLAVAGVALGVLIAVGIAVLRPSDHSPALPPAPSAVPTATATPKATATAQAPTAPVAATAAPDAGSASDHVRHFLEAMRAARNEDALTALAAAAAADRTVLDGPEPRGAVLDLLARLSMLGSPKTAEAFALVGRELGSLGPDLLLEIAMTRGGTSAATHADRLLKDPEVLALGTDAMRVAYDLRMARSCEKKLALFKRAGEVGDVRAQAELTRIRECHPNAGCCMRDNPTLTVLIDAIGARIGWPSTAPAPGSTAIATAPRSPTAPTPTGTGTVPAAPTATVASPAPTATPAAPATTPRAPDPYD